jgi:hypothetical protein
MWREKHDGSVLGVEAKWPALKKEELRDELMKFFECFMFLTSLLSACQQNTHMRR